MWSFDDDQAGPTKPGGDAAPHLPLSLASSVLSLPLSVLSIYRDFPGILIGLILKTSGMGKRYLWGFDCLIPRQPF